MKAPFKRKNIAGFTLVEVLVASVISAFIIGAIFGIYKTGGDLWDIKSYQADLQAKARIGMEGMTKELKQATRTSSRIPSPNAVLSALPNNTNITFYLPADIDGDGRFTDNSTGAIEWDTNNAIQYLYNPGQQELTRLYNSTQTTIAQDVSDIRFIDTGLDSQLYPTELKIVLTLSQITPRQRTITTALTSMVKLRN